MQKKPNADLFEQISSAQASLAELERMEREYHVQAIGALEQNREDLARKALAQKILARRDAQELRSLLEGLKPATKPKRTARLVEQAEVVGEQILRSLRFSRMVWFRVASNPDLKRVLSGLSKTLPWRKSSPRPSEDRWHQLDTIVKLNRELKTHSRGL